MLPHYTLWNINVRKQAINDKLQGSVAVLLSLALALRVKSLALSKSPWPRQIFQGTSEPQKPWHAIACFIALIALLLFIAWTCATVELLCGNLANCYTLVTYF